MALSLPVTGAADVIDDVEDAVEFWENRNADKFAFWQEVLEALNGAEISDELMEEVSQSWANANPGGRMYNTWKGVYDTLTAAKALQDIEPVTEEEVPEIPATDESEEEVPTLEPVTEEEIPATEETEVEVPVAVIEAVEDAVEFWENRNADKFAFWQEVLEALNGAEISDELMEEVSQSWANANSGGRMYNTWKGVYEAFTALRAEPEESPKPVDQNEVGDTDNVVDWEIPDVQPEDAPEDLVVLQSDENNNNPVQPAWFDPPEAEGTPPPAWFNPGGGYTKAKTKDGYLGWRESQWGQTSFATENPDHYTEDRCDQNGECIALVPQDAFPGVDCSIEPNKCRQIANPDGILDWTYYSYEDAQVNEDYPGRNLAKLGWGPWDDLPMETRGAITGIALPSYTEMAAELGAVGTSNGWAVSTLTGTARYEGEAEGVFRPDLFGTVYGTKDDPSTPDKNEYDDGDPRISLTVNFDNLTIDGELTARMTAQRLGFGPPVRQSLGLDEGYRWHSAHSHFFECPDSTCAETYTAVRPSSKNDGDGTYVHGRIETTVDVDEMLRTPVVRWNGVRFVYSGGHAFSSFDGQGLWGEFIATCKSGSENTCFGHVDSTAAIRGYINHPRFVGSYGAAKCASDGTCPGFEMPELVPGTVVHAYDSWGPWDDLPLATRQDIAGTATVADMTARQKHTGDNRTFWLPDGTGLTHGGPIRETWWVPTSLPSSGTATWRTHGDSFNAVINPAYSDLSDPILTLTADLSAGTIGAGITFMQSGTRTEALESWSGLTVTDGGFSGDGLTGQVHNWRLKYLQGSTVIQSHNTGAAAIFGTVNTERVVGTYHADRDE